MSSRSFAAQPYKNKSIFYLTTANAAAGAGPGLLQGDLYANDVSSNLGTIAAKINDPNFSMDINANSYIFVRSRTLPSQPYILGISYIDTDGNTYANYDVTELPFSLATNTMPPAPLFLDGITGNPYHYVATQLVYGDSDITLMPQPGTTPSEVPLILTVYINVQLQTSPGVLEEFFLMSYTINITNYGFLPTSDIGVTIPPWTAWPYWVQDLFGVENIFGTFAFGGNNDFVMPRGYYPTQTIPVAQFLGPTTEALLPTDSLPVGVPSALVQAILGVVDTANVGNQSAGKILTLFLFQPAGPNLQGFEWNPNYLEQTQNVATAVGSQSTWLYGFQDFAGRPFRSITACFDITAPLTQYAK